MINSILDANEDNIEQKEGLSVRTDDSEHIVEFITREVPEENESKSDIIADNTVDNVADNIADSTMDTNTNDDIDQSF